MVSMRLLPERLRTLRPMKRSQPSNFDRSEADHETMKRKSYWLVVLRLLDDKYRTGLDEIALANLSSAPSVISHESHSRKTPLAASCSRTMRAALVTLAPKDQLQ